MHTQSTVEIPYFPGARRELANVIGDFEAAVRDAHRRARATGGPILAWSGVRVPAEDPIELIERGDRRRASQVLWLQPRGRFGVAGIGRAWVFAGGGRNRFAAAEAAWRSVCETAVVHDADPGPVGVYGFGFDDSSGWEGYPGALILIPRVSLHWRGDGCRLTLAAIVRPEETPEDAASRTLACARSYAEPTGSLGPAACANGDQPAVVGEFPSADVWKRSVAETAVAVRRARLRKAVLARGVTVRGAGQNAAAALRRLRAEYPDCTIFAVGRGDRCFLGASPERLVRLRHGEVAVSALAGSAPRGATAACDRELGAQLLRSDKELLEHRLVVDALRDVLAEVSSAVSCRNVPQLLTVRNTHHLHTPMRAVLRSRRSIFDLIGRLHPTPAVGGVPRDAALAWIRQHEGWDRGWYAGPVGWVNADGDGEAAVAIRSGLIAGEHAHLFAGCGIMADSDPEREFEESNWKLRPLLSALAVRLSGGAPGDPGGVGHAPRLR